MRGLFWTLSVLLLSGSSWAQEDYIGVWGVEDETGYFLIELRSDGIAVSNELFVENEEFQGWVSNYSVSGQTITLSGGAFFFREDSESEWEIDAFGEPATIDFEIADGIFSYIWEGEDVFEDPLSMVDIDVFIHDDALEFLGSVSTAVEQQSWGRIKRANSVMGR